MTKFLNESGFRRIIKTIKNAIGKKQDALESGVNIKTVNNNSLLGDGDLTIKGITSISTVETSESGGSNTVAIKTTDGQTTSFNVKNGKDGADGVSLGEIGLVQNTGEGTDVVMSQQAVSKEVHRISDEDLNGTSEWIKLRLVELGWEIGKKLNGNNVLSDDATRCVTPLMELPTLDNHSYTFHYGTTGDTGSAWCFYYGDGVRLRAYQHEGYYDYEKTVTPGAQFNWRLTVGLDKIAECFIYDDTANNYLWRGDEYLKDICKKYLVDYEKLIGEISNVANEKERVNLFNPANVLEGYLLDTTYGKIGAWDATTKGEYAAVAKIPVKKNHYYCIINPYFSDASGTPRVGVMLGNTDFGNSTKHNIVFSGGKYTVAKAAYTSDVSIDTLTFQLYRTQNTVPYPIETPMVEVYEMHSIDEAISYINSRVGETREINDSVNIDNKILESNVGTLSSMMSNTSMLVFGDSITANHGWSNYIANKLKWKGISNIAIGGANISGSYNVTSGNQRNLVYQIRQAANLLGDVCYAEGTLNNNTYTKVFDIVFISMGFNDAKNGYACGSLDDVKDVEWSTLAPANDNTNFPSIAKAIKYCIFYLKNNVITGTVTINGETKNVAVDCRKARFIWQTPIGTSTIYGTWTAEQTDARLRDVENVITKICNHYSIQVINGRLTSGITREEEGLVSGGKYLSDGIHPNGDGYIKMGEMNLGGILGNNANNLVPQLMQTTGDSEESVMSQKAVTEYGRKVTAEDLNGTSDWIRTKLTAEGWEFGKKLNNGSGTIATDASLCVSAYIPVNSIKGHSITYNLGDDRTLWRYVVYDANKTALNGRYTNASQYTLTLSDDFYTTAAYIRFTLDLSSIDECYCYDNTIGCYIFKGGELISQVIESNGGLVDYGILQGSLVTQQLGDSGFKMVSQKTITEQLETSHIFKTHYSNFAVSQGYNASDERDGKLISVDTWNMAELKILTSLRLTDLYSGAIMNNYRHCHLLGIGNSLTDDYFSIYEQDYNWYIWCRKNGTDVLKYQIGDYRAYYRLFAVMDFYNKTISLYGYRNATNGNETLIDHYDFSSLDLSNFTDVHILTGYGASNSAYQYANWIEINNFVFDWEERLDLGKNMVFGSYNSLGSQSMVRGITTLPSEFMFTNESNTEGITVTLNEPYHKIVEVNSDTAKLVYNVGFYRLGATPTNYQTNCFEIFKVKFTNVSSNVLLRGWSGMNTYIIDKNYTFTKIPMDSTTGTVLSYEVTEGDTYLIMHPVGNGYATRYNHYFGGHFTMEITEPILLSVGKQNLVCQSYNGTYFEGYFPFKGVLFPTEEFGQFTTQNYPNMTGRIRINNGNIQIYNGSVWKQINNS